MYGEKFNLGMDEEILKINSPKEHCKGPYIVVFKSPEGRWVIVGLDWDNSPTLGIRWFWDKTGNPSSRGNATWFILPKALHNTILNGLPLDMSFRNKINRFLTGEISGNELKKGGAK
ncbi:MAG: hypothetical protein LBG80_07075 [Bacteroidales bacterium]|jgi:hypothetical protein|nr:hypothetical protein [Bacteroidales bacterium]